MIFIFKFLPEWAKCNSYVQRKSLRNLALLLSLTKWYDVVLFDEIYLFIYVSSVFLKQVYTTVHGVFVQSRRGMSKNGTNVSSFANCLNRLSKLRVHVKELRIPPYNGHSKRK